MSPVLLANLAAAPPAERRTAIEQMLQGPAGEMLRRTIGTWVMRLVPVETLVPQSAERWRPLVSDAMGFFFSRLSAARLADKIVEQIDLAPDTPPEKRLLRLISRMPGLQKIGQVLARNPRLAPPLRASLIELENGISDVTAAEVEAILRNSLGDRLQEFAVRLDAQILSEASVSAVVRFTWNNPDRERERCVFKVLKPHIPGCFAEDMKLLQELGRYLAGRKSGYGFARRQVDEMLTEVRLLLVHELDFRREQATLAEAARTYRGTLGIRVPKVIPALSTGEITAMTEETGVKVTDALRRSPIRRRRIAEQLIEALIAVPLFSAQDHSTFHADPHAGNLLYDGPNRELIVLDWALAERLSLPTRRELVMLAVMMSLRNVEAVRKAIEALRRPGAGSRRALKIIGNAVSRFFADLPPSRSPGVLDAMRLLDEIALAGVSFDAPLFLFRKSLFTLDGVLQDIAGAEVRMDQVIVRYFLARWAASFCLFYSPLSFKDFLSVEWNALLYPVRSWKQASEKSASDGGRAVRGPAPSPRKKLPLPAKARRPAPRRPQSRPAG
ncbi:MAG TPA: AarF/UbiB family protein [Bryobacteraceae bacterium]|nr:AarF/UbiB family protein [Bryobacteraceae bacterium]